MTTSARTPARQARRLWGIENNTLVIFMTDNGGTAGARTYNAGDAWQQGDSVSRGRVPSLLAAQPSGFKGMPQVDAFTAHLDILPTLAEIVGAPPHRTRRKPWWRHEACLPLLKDPGPNGPTAL